MKLRNLFPILVATFLLGGAELAAKASSNFIYLKCDGKMTGFEQEFASNQKTFTDDVAHFNFTLDEANSRIRAAKEWLPAAYTSEKISFTDTTKYKGRLYKHYADINRSNGKFKWSTTFADKNGSGLTNTVGTCKQKSPTLF